MRRQISRYWLGGLAAVVLAAGLSMVWVARGNPATADPAPTILFSDNQLTSWTLNNWRVVNAGQTATLAEGVLTTGYMMEAEATNTNGLQTRYANFQLTLTTFQPSQDMPGQKAGTWYVNGVWTLTDLNASAYTKSFRHNPALLEGKLSAELGYDPLTASNGFEATLQIPLSQTGGRWITAAGTLAVNRQTGGTLGLAAAQSPESAAIERQLAEPNLGR